jgi:dihydropteroate synthase
MPKGRKYYSTEEKIKTLKLLEINGFNYTRTQNATGVNLSTIKVWVDKLGDKVFQEEDSRVKDIADKVNIVSDIMKDDFLKKAWDTNIDLINRIKELIPTETRIFTLVSVMRIIHEILNSKSVTPLTDKDANDIFQTINNQQIINNQTIINNDKTTEHKE